MKENNPQQRVIYSVTIVSITGSLENRKGVNDGK